jgi:beta-galactosidase
VIPGGSGKEISLDFDGVFNNSYVYLNGQLLGNHPYGYTGSAMTSRTSCTPTDTPRTRWP